MRVIARDQTQTTNTVEPLLGKYVAVILKILDLQLFNL